MIPVINRIRCDLAVFERQLDQFMDEHSELEKQYQLLKTTYDGLLIEKQNLEKKYLELLKNGEHNTDNKKS